MKTTMLAGYSNEIDGYLPDAAIVAEGGYEARGLVADIGFYSAEAQGAKFLSVSWRTTFKTLILHAA